MDTPELNHRLEEFGRQLTEATRVINELRDTLVGTLHGTGLVHRQTLMEDKLGIALKQLESVYARVKALEDDQMKVRGMMAVVAFLSGLVPFVISKIWK